MLRVATTVLGSIWWVSAVLAQTHPLVRSMGVAVSARGEVFQIFNQAADEETVKAAIRAICESKTRGHCESLSVSMAWSVVVLQCNKSDEVEEWFLGGSGTGFARRRAINKANSAGYESTNCKDSYIY